MLVPRAGTDQLAASTLNPLCNQGPCQNEKAAQRALSGFRFNSLALISGVLAWVVADDFLRRFVPATEHRRGGDQVYGIGYSGFLMPSFSSRLRKVLG